MSDLALRARLLCKLQPGSEEQFPSCFCYSPSIHSVLCFCRFDFVFSCVLGCLFFTLKSHFHSYLDCFFWRWQKNAVLAKMDKYEVYIEFLVFVLCFTDVSRSRQCYAIPCEHKAKALVFIVRSYRVDRCPTWGIRNALPPSLGWAGDRIRMPQLFHSMLLLNMQGDEDFITSTPCFNVVSVIIQVLRIHCQLSAVQLMKHPSWPNPFTYFISLTHLSIWTCLNPS